MAAAASSQYRTEHVAETPRGWRVRMKAPGPRSEHLVAIAFPPGRRKKGSGRLVEILHPAGERNPCPVSKQAKENPQELVIFGLGNPARSSNYFSETVRKGSDGVVIWANTDAGPYHVTAYVNNMETIVGERGKYATLERARKKARKWLDDHASHKSNRGRSNADLYEVVEVSESGTPRTVSKALPRGEAKKFLAELRAVRDRAQGKWVLFMRRGKKNPIRMRIFHDPAIKKFTAAMYDDKLGNLYASGYTKKEAARALREVWRRERRQRGLNASPRKARNQSSVYSKAVSLGYPYIRGEGKVAKDGETWLSRATKNSDGSGPAVYVGWSQKTRKWIIERRANPSKRRRHNPITETEQAVHLFEIFHGKEPREIVEKHVSAAMRKDYTALGKLIAVGTDDCGFGENSLATKWDQCPHLDFSEDHVTLASSPDGRQLYAIGGNQNLNGCLEKFEGVDPAKDFVDLGDVAFVTYEARKIHDNFEPVEYTHRFGGHGNTRPRWMYDRLKKQIFFLGGEYLINIEAQISPGIEG